MIGNGHAGFGRGDAGKGQSTSPASLSHPLRRPAIGVTLRNRQTAQPPEVLQIAWRAQHRLHRTHQHLRARGKPGNVVTVAVARELSASLWATATLD